MERGRPARMPKEGKAGVFCGRHARAPPLLGF